MTISKVNGAGWAFGDKLTAAQTNSFDTKIITALDRTVAGDTLQGVITLSGVARFVETVVAGADADTSYTAASGRIIRVAALTADRTYTLSDTGAAAGDTIEVMVLPTIVRALTVMSAVTSTNLVRLSGTTPTLTGTNFADNAQSALFLFNGTSWELIATGKNSGVRQLRLTASANFVAPPNCTLVAYRGAGGGGGGGGGAGGKSSDGGSVGTSVGGGGGGGAIVSPMLFYAVTPGSTYAYTIGAGGTGGAGGAADLPGSAGVAGGDSTIFGTTFPGASAGAGGTLLTSTTTPSALGGFPVKTAGGSSRRPATNQYFAIQPGQGGIGTSRGAASTETDWGDGGASGAGPGGAMGTVGADLSVNGGGPGGGGGASRAAGGAGGNGGNSWSGSVSAPATPTAPTANSGAGGGGGGGGGGAPATTAAGGATGAAGAAGFIDVILF